MKFPQGRWTLLGPGSEEEWYGSSSYAQKGEWDSTANKTVVTIQTKKLVILCSTVSVP